jgi:PDZ domain-containing protein
VRFSLETGSATLGLVGLVLLALAMPRAWRWERLQPDRTSPVPGRWWRIPLAGVLLVGMLGVTVGVLPTNDGLRLPGEAIAVEPMIRVPAEVRQTPGGNFFLTTVIPQTPILVVQRVYGELSPVVEIVPPAQIVPPDITPQEMARISSRMLVESETIAILVGLRLAGYEADLVPLGVMVESVLPESPSQGRLEPGDVVTAINGQPVESAEALVERIQAQDPEATVVLAVERDGQPLEVRVPLMPPEEPDGAPKVGITIGPADFDLDLPFEVEIVPQRVTGGPSAGLMFTLTLYNLVTPEDLTGGYKIAGTGTIAMDGRIGPIGGVEQKVAAAERAGAVYFLSPPENYTDARAVARRIEVVEVATAQEAITFLEGLRPVE